MTARSLLRSLKCRDIHLTPAGNNLRCDAPAGVLVEADRQQIRTQKLALLWLLRVTGQLLEAVRQLLQDFKAAHAVTPGQQRAVEALASAFEKYAREGNPLLFSQAADLDEVLDRLASEWASDPSGCRLVMTPEPTGLPAVSEKPWGREDPETERLTNE
jgi:hypothetical protein